MDPQTIDIQSRKWPASVCLRYIGLCWTNFPTLFTLFGHLLPILDVKAVHYEWSMYVLICTCWFNDIKFVSKCCVFVPVVRCVYYLSSYDYIHGAYGIGNQSISTFVRRRYNYILSTWTIAVLVIPTHNVWIRRQVCYTRYTIAPHKRLRAWKFHNKQWARMIWYQNSWSNKITGPSSAVMHVDLVGSINLAVSSQSCYDCNMKFNLAMCWSIRLWCS